MFDFFANCEYFEEKYNYDEILKLPKEGGVKPPKLWINTYKTATFDCISRHNYLEFIS